MKRDGVRPREAILRRIVLQLLFAECLLAANAAIGGRPNLLIIMSDEHNAGVPRCYGNKIIGGADPPNPLRSSHQAGEGEAATKDRI